MAGVNVVLALLIVAGYVSADLFDLTIIHTNDVHSRFVETHKYGGNCRKEQAARGECVGGAARRYGYSSFLLFSWHSHHYGEAVGLDTWCPLVINKVTF